MTLQLETPDRINKIHNDVLRHLVNHVNPVSSSMTSFRQSLDEVIESQPQTPTMVIESQRKSDPDYEQYR